MLAMPMTNRRECQYMKGTMFSIEHSGRLTSPKQTPGAGNAWGIGVRLQVPGLCCTGHARRLRGRAATALLHPAAEAVHKAAGVLCTVACFCLLIGRWVTGCVHWLTRVGKLTLPACRPGKLLRTGIASLGACNAHAWKQRQGATGILLGQLRTGGYQR